MSFFCSSCSYKWSRTYFEGTSCTCPFCGKYLLHDALCNYSKINTDDIILALIKANKDAAHQQNSRGLLPLHYAMEKNVSDNVILALIEANKDAVNKLDRNGRLPLCAAIDNRCSDEVILALLEANKDVLYKLDCSGSLLQQAIKLRRSDAVILALLEANKDAANKPADRGKLPIDYAIELKCSDKVILALLVAHKDAANNLDHDRRIPLRRAMELRCSDTVILALLGATTVAVTKLERVEQPLHEAIELKLSDRVILSILEFNKEAAKERSHCSSRILPLHRAIELQYSDTVILALLDANKNAASQPDSKCALPLHKALDNKLSDNVILALLAADNDVAKKEIWSNQSMLSRYLPLHRVIELKLSDQVILAFLAAFEGATEKWAYGRNKTLFLSLDLALEYNCSNKVILALLAANIDAASGKYFHQKLPLVVAIELNFNEDIISALATAYPDAACHRDSNNMVLMQHAIQKGYSESILAELLAAVFNSSLSNNQRERDETLSIIIQGNMEQVVLKAAAILSDHKRCNMLCNIIEKTNTETVLVSLASKYPTVTTMSYDDGPVNKAIACKRSDEVILALLEVTKNYAKKGKKDDHYPLHTAMYQKRSDNVVLALLAANPDAAVELDRIGENFPLHNAIEAHPKAASNINANHLLPIQRALKMNYSDTVIISFLIAIFNKSDLSGSYHNVVKHIVQTKGAELVLQAAKGLHDVARQNIILRNLIETVTLDSLVISMISRFPETLNMRCLNGTFALHIALEFKRSEEVVFAIFNGYKDASKEKSVSGELPLHQAIRNQYSEEFVLALFDAYNDASQKESVDGELPLHQAIKNQYSDQVALKILSAYPCAAMIPCKTSGKLPLHFAAASSASARLVESLIAEYPEALQIAVNNLTPRNMVTSTLPTESIKLICRPSLHNNEIRPAQHAEQGKAEESGDTESLKQVALEVTKMAKMFEGFCSNLLELNGKVDAVQKRLKKHSTEPNSGVSLVDNASSLVGGSTAGDFDPLGMPIAFIPPITKIHKKKKKKRTKKKTAEVVKQNKSDPIEFSEPPSLAAIVDLFDLSCNDATSLKTNSTAAPHQSETFEPSGSFESQVDSLQLKKQQNSVITESLLRSQTSAAECSATKVTDVCASKLSDVKVDFDEVPPASEVHSKLFSSAESSDAESSECGTIASEQQILDVSSNGSNTANFNSFVIVGKHIREKSLGAPKLVDKVTMEHNPKTDNLDEVESFSFLEKVSSKSSVSGSSDGGFSFVDDGMSNSDTGETVKDNDDIISIKSSID